MKQLSYKTTAGPVVLSPDGGSKNHLNRPRHGVTMVELLVYVVILIMVFGMVYKLFPYMSQTQRGVKRLDALHVLRNCSAKISDAVSYGTKIVFPGTDSQFHKILGFLNSRNGLMVIFYDVEQKALVLLDCDKRAAGDKNAVTILGEGELQFEVKRKDSLYLNYKLTIWEGRPNEVKRDYVLSNSTNIRNDFR